MTLSALLGGYAVLMVPVVAVGWAIGRVGANADTRDDDVTRQFLAGIEREPVSFRRSLSLAREAIDMPVAYLAELCDGHERVLVANGRWSGDDADTSLTGLSVPIDDTLCQRIERDDTPSYVPDLARDSTATDQARELGIRAWIGAPVDTRFARRFVLCCLSGEARPMLGEGELRTLTLVADGLARQLDAVAAGAEMALA